MVTNRITSVLLLGVLSTLLTGCPGESVRPAYSFKVAAVVIPEKEFYALGDTIWIESSTSTTLKDQQSGEDVNFDRAENFGAGLGITELFDASDTTTQPDLDAAKYFGFTVIRGRLTPSVPAFPDRGRYFRYEEDNGIYRYKVALICNKEGIYNLTLLDASNVYRKASGSNRRAGVVFSFSNVDKHLHYLQDLYYKKESMPESVKTTSYCFVVK